MMKAVALVVLLISVSSIAKADGIDFSGGTGGSLAFTPAVGQDLTVSNAPINMLWALSSPGTTYSVTSGLLNFTTGAATMVTSNPPNPFCGGTTCALFGAGASTDLTLTGTVSGIAGATGTLLSGQFLSGNGTFSSSFGNVTGLFSVNSLNPSLLQAIFGSGAQGTSGTLAQVLFNVSFNGTSYTGTIGSTNLIAGIASIQEPATLLLFGSGLLAGAALLRRALQKGKGSPEEDPS